MSIVGTHKLHVVLPVPQKEGYDYLCPAGGEAPPPGAFVLAPLGKRELSGVVWGEAKDEVPPEKMKPLLAVHDLPPMTQGMRVFLERAAAYTLSPLGVLVKMALPVPEALEPETARMAARSAKEKGEPGDPPPGKAPELSPTQAQAAAELAGKLRAGGYSVTVLDGVTGSGKTEVYFEAIAAALEQGRQVLVLLPEITLTLPWLARFRARFGMEPVPWHSGLTRAQRRRNWRAIARGEARLVAGARSALFLPYPELGLIVVDEEHEQAYKQEEGVSYHARDMAVLRAHAENIPTILVSATPSLETMMNVQAGRYERLHLPERHGGARYPEVKLIDMRQEKMPASEFITPSLRLALAENLAAGLQSLLYLNRRGYAPLMLCRACGHRLECPHCTAWLVYHQRTGKLHCHHCGFSKGGKEYVETCPSCKVEGKLAPCGPGVERLAEEVRAFLPQARVGVMTSDHMDSPAEAEAFLRAVEAGEVDVVIGTQMLAKGHHFPTLTLVGVVDADLGLAGGDPRACERTYQLLHQVAGRAGRAGHAGRAVLQTAIPEHPVMQALLLGARDAFLGLEEESRRAARMPPFARLAALLVTGKDEKRVRDYMAQLARAAPNAAGVEVWGPAPAPLARIRRQFRYRFLLRAEKTAPLQKMLKEWLARVPAPSALRVKVDVDPYSFS